MNIKYSSTLLGAALGLALLSAPANGAVVDLDSGFNLNNDDSAVTDAELGNLDFTGASKLVVTVGVKGSNLAPANQAGTVTYNGTTMDFAVGSGFPPGNGSAYGWVGIYYLDNPGTVGIGDILVQDPGYSLGVFATVLSGTAAGFGNTASTTSAATVTIGASAGSAIIAGFSDGSGGGTPQSPLVAIGSGNVGSGNHGAGYQTVASASTLTPTFSSGSRPSTVAAEFTAVPEPAAALFGGLALLALLRRRR